MLNKVKAYIDSHHLLDSGKYLLALSGGADSVCLLRMMLSLGYDIEAVHCNFKLRGEESDRDERFCDSLCQSHGIVLHKVHFDTKEYASLHKISIEMAARELRYNYFEQLRVALDAKGILVAHHRDDNIETVLLNIIRGTGIRGLEGIKPRNGMIIRPLLCLSRQDILSYLSSINQEYITDSSNMEADVQRNKIRLNVIPVLKDIMSSATDNISNTINHVAEAVKVYDDAINNSISLCFKEERIDLEALYQQPSPEAVLYEILSRYGFYSVQVQQIYNCIQSSQPGKIWKSEHYVVAMDRTTLIIGKPVEALPVMVIPECGIYRYAGDTATISLEEKEFSSMLDISKEPSIATLDAEKITFPLTLRPVKPADRFTPFGMKGYKLVSDYLTDKKRNYFQRNSQLVIEDATGEIIWLVGERVSAQVAITADTIKTLTIRYY